MDWIKAVEIDFPKKDNVTYRPWGSFEVLTGAPGYKVKKIIVEPQGHLSLQSHLQRDEHWFVVFGRGVAIIGDEHMFLTKGHFVDIPAKTKHRLRNISDAVNLVIIEVQTGSYCGEDDIIRYEDVYGRGNPKNDTYEQLELF